MRLQVAMMKNSCKQSCRQHDRTAGFTMVELVLVMFVISVLAAITVPNVMLTISNVKLRGTAADLAGMMQQARTMAAKNNPQNPPAYAIKYAVLNGAQSAFVDLNGDGVWNASVTVAGVTTSEPVIAFGSRVIPAPAPPNGSGGQPPAYVLTGDSSTGGPFTNANTLAFTPRGLPCDYSAPPACASPAPSYFVYYLTDTRVGNPGWAAVVVTKGGRTRVVTWNGSSWN
jgi:prepilin-type N-terminal cleavage/methylation domain-containing protein